MVTKYKIIDKRAAKQSNGEKIEKGGADRVMGNVWKLMKYTQGENSENKTMKLHMPMFIHLETLINDNESKVDAENVFSEDGETVEVKLMITLPAEYQFDPKNPDKNVLEPPKPNDDSVFIETLDDFQCYVRLDLFLKYVNSFVNELY